MIVYERNAWVILFVLWAVHLALALRDFFPASQDICLACLPGAKSPMQVSIGMTWMQLVASTPEFARFLSATLVDDGISGVGFAALGMVISVTGFKRGERWAWYFSWSLPIGILAAQLNQYELTGSVVVIILTLAFLAGSLLGIFLPYRTFFPKRRPLT